MGTQGALAEEEATRSLSPALALALDTAAGDTDPTAAPQARSAASASVSASASASASASTRSSGQRLSSLAHLRPFTPPSLSSSPVPMPVPVATGGAIHDLDEDASLIGRDADWHWHWQHYGPMPAGVRRRYRCWSPSRACGILVGAIQQPECQWADFARGCQCQWGVVIVGVHHHPPRLRLIRVTFIRLGTSIGTGISLRVMVVGRNGHWQCSGCTAAGDWPRPLPVPVLSNCPSTVIFFAVIIFDFHWHASAHERRCQWSYWPGVLPAGHWRLPVCRYIDGPHTLLARAARPPPMVLQALHRHWHWQPGGHSPD